MAKVIVGYNKCKFTENTEDVIGTWVYDTCKDKVYYKKGLIEGLKESKDTLVAKYIMNINEDRDFVKLCLLHSNFLDLSLYLKRQKTPYNIGYTKDKNGKFLEVTNEIVDTDGDNKYFVMMVWSRSRVNAYPNFMCDLSIKNYMDSEDSLGVVANAFAIPEIVYWRLIYLMHKNDFKAILSILPNDIGNLLYYHYVYEEHLDYRDFKIKEIR